MRSVLTISVGLLFGLALSSVAHANDHKILGVIAMPRNETNDLALKIPVCRIVKRIQLTADHGDIELSGASVYFKTARSASQSLNVPSSIKKARRQAGSILIAITTTNAAYQRLPSQVIR